MKSNILQQKNYSAEATNYQLFLPLNYENITTEKGVLLRMNRSIQSEGAFGVLKQDRQFDRFLTRGKPNVTTELLLLCFGYNVNELHSKIQNERCGKPLHELKTA